MTSRRNFLIASPFVAGAIISYTSGLQVPYIRVDTKTHELALYSDGDVKRYPAFFGPNDEDKISVKDDATPRGRFYVCQKARDPQPKSLGTRWMRLSYPSYEDAERGLRTGLITERQYRSILDALKRKQIPPQNTKLGGGIGIHGTPQNVQRFYRLYSELHEASPSFSSMISNLFDMTRGCVALFNKDIEELYGLTPVGTEVEVV